MTQLVVVTDLDGTLLDWGSFAWAAAQPALAELKRRRVPIVFCTSRTAAEVLALQREMDVRDAFIAEGGGAVYLPRGEFPQGPEMRVDRGAHEVVVLSAGHREIMRGIDRLRALTENSIRAFEDMTVDEVARLTGLSPGMAAMAKRRDYDEPFYFLRREDEFAAHLTDAAIAMGLRVTRGARFFHLHGDTDKGRAVRELASLQRAKLGPVHLVGLGDSGLDRSLLTAVDTAVIVPRHEGRIDPGLAAGVPHAIRAPLPGPAGWNAAILQLLA